MPAPYSQGRKRNPNPNFLVRIFSSGGGVFYVNGWGPKSSVCPSKPGKSNILGGIFRDFARISGVPENPKNLLRLILGDNLQRLKLPENRKITLKMANFP